jgi:hypothetical protein
MAKVVVTQTKTEPWRKQMIAKSLIAAAAVAASLTALAPVEQAQAKLHVNATVNIGAFPGYYPGYYPDYGYGGGYYPVIDPYFGGGKSCWQVKHKLQNLNFKFVHPYDCNGPVYHYTAKKFGNPVKVTANWHGTILSVKHL